MTDTPTPYEHLMDDLMDLRVLPALGRCAYPGLRAWCVTHSSPETETGICVALERMEARARETIERRLAKRPPADDDQRPICLHAHNVNAVCERGCTRARRHEPDCEGGECQGCLPMAAHHGRLCCDCWSRLRSMIVSAPRQVEALRTAVQPSSTATLTAETQARTAKRPRTESSQSLIGPSARMTVASASNPEPIRLACVDAETDLMDLLASLVDDVAEESGSPRPVALHTAEGDRRALVWRPVQPDGTPRYRHEVVHTYRDPGEVQRGQYVWVERDPGYDVHTACRWLLANLDRLSAIEGIGDRMEVLAYAMSTAHGVAPWRLQSAHLHGIPCPRCHHHTLVRYGGEVDVDCQHQGCKARFDPQRYGIWVRQLAAEHASEAS